MKLIITAVETRDIRFPTSKTLDGSDAMNADPDYSAAYVILKTNVAGFVSIDYISKKKPSPGIDFIKAKVDFVLNDPVKTINIAYPFDRFYMEESKAYNAEQEYRESQLDSTKTTYALVSIKDGDAVLKDVFIDEIPLGDLMKEQP